MKLCNVVTQLIDKPGGNLKIEAERYGTFAASVSCESNHSIPYAMKESCSLTISRIVIKAWFPPLFRKSVFGLEKMRKSLYEGSGVQPKESVGLVCKDEDEDEAMSFVSYLHLNHLRQFVLSILFYLELEY